MGQVNAPVQFRPVQNFQVNPIFLPPGVSLADVQKAMTVIQSLNTQTQSSLPTQHLGNTAPGPRGFGGRLCDTFLAFMISVFIFVGLVVMIFSVVSPYLIPLWLVTAGAVQFQLVYPEVIVGVTSSSNQQTTLSVINAGIVFVNVSIQAIRMGVELWNYMLTIIHAAAFPLEEVGEEFLTTLFGTPSIQTVLLNILRLTVDTMEFWASAFTRVLSSMGTFVTEILGTATASRTLLQGVPVTNEGILLGVLNLILRKLITITGIIVEFAFQSFLLGLKVVMPAIGRTAFKIFFVLQSFYFHLFQGELKDVLETAHDLTLTGAAIENAVCATDMMVAYTACETAKNFGAALDDINGVLCTVHNIIQGLGTTTASLAGSIVPVSSFTAAVAYRSMALTTMRSLMATPDSDLNYKTYAPPSTAPLHMRGNPYAIDVRAKRQNRREARARGQTNVFPDPYVIKMQRMNTINGLLKNKQVDATNKWMKTHQKYEQWLQEQITKERVATGADTNPGGRKLSGISDCFFIGADPLVVGSCVQKALRLWVGDAVGDAVTSVEKAMAAARKTISDTLTTLTNTFNTFRDDINKTVGDLNKDVANLQGELAGLTLKIANQENNFDTAFEKGVQQMFKTASNQSCTQTINFFGPWLEEAEEAVADLSCHRIVDMCGPCNFSPAKCATDKLGEMFTNISSLVTNFQARFSIWGQIPLFMGAFNAAMKETNVTAGSWVDEYNSTGIIMIYLNNTAQMIEAMEKALLNVDLSDLNVTAGGTAVNIPDFSKVGAYRAPPPCSSTTGLCQHQHARDQDKPDDGTYESAVGSGPGTSQFDDQEPWPRTTFSQMTTNELRAGMATFSKKRWLGIVGVGSHGGVVASVTPADVAAQAQRTLLFKLITNVRRQILQASTGTTTATENVLDAHNDAGFSDISSTNPTTDIDPDDDCESTVADPFKCCSITSTSHACCNGIIGCLPDMPNVKITPLSNLNKLHSLTCPAFAGGGNPLISGIQGHLFVIRTIMSGEVTQFLVQCPEPIRPIWTFLVGWMQFEDGVMPPNGYLCLALNIGGPLSLFSLFSILAIAAVAFILTPIVTRFWGTALNLLGSVLG